MTNKKSKLLSVATLGFICLACCVLIAMNHSPSYVPVKLPPEDQIERMTASVNDHYRSWGVASVPSFDIPQKYYKTILDAISPAVSNEHLSLMKQPALGQLEITANNGQVFRISYYPSGQTPICYIVNEIHCSRGGRYMPAYIDDKDSRYVDESLLFCSLLNELYELLQNRGEQGDFLDISELLKRSRGDSPPEPT